jgi:hypothetical protein
MLQNTKEVSETYLYAVNDVLAKCDCDLATVEVETEDIALRRDAIQSLIRRTNTALNLPSPLECEQRCDCCGEDVEEVWIRADGAEVCRRCFDRALLSVGGRINFCIERFENGSWRWYGSGDTENGIFAELPDNVYQLRDKFDSQDSEVTGSDAYRYRPAPSKQHRQTGKTRERCFLSEIGKG